MKDETHKEDELMLWNEYIKTSEYKEYQDELERQHDSTNKQRKDEDAEWKILTSKQKGVLFNYGLFLRACVNFNICRTISAHWTKQSNFWYREDSRSYETRTTKFRRDEIYWSHLVNYAEQKKMINGTCWEDRRLTEEELKVLRIYYDETREKAMNDAIKYMDLHFPNEI